MYLDAITSPEMATARVILLDDDYSYLLAAAESVEGHAFDVITTQESSWALQLISEGEAAVLVCDLAIPGQPDGIFILEEAHKIRSSLHLVLLTGHTLSDVQSRRLERIGANHYSKGTSFLQLLEDLASRSHDSNSVTGDIRTIQRENEELRELTRELIDHWIAELKEIPEFESAVIAAEPAYTVGELIHDLDQLTPRGIEHLKLWIRAFETMRRLPRRKV